MHAIAKMLRIYPDRTEVPIERMIGPSAIAEINEGERVKILLWHGPCLEAEAEISVSNGRTLVRLTEKKELRLNPPREAVE